MRCATIFSVEQEIKREQEHGFSGGERADGSKDRGYRAIPDASERHWFTGSADCVVERAHQLPDDPPQVPRKGSRFPSRVDYDGQQAPETAGLPEPPRPRSVSRDCGTTQLA